MGNKPLLWDEIGPASESHRMARVGKDLEVHLVPFPHDEQGCQTLAQDAQSPSNLNLSVSRDGPSTYSLGSLSQCLPTSQQRIYSYM